MWSGRCSRYAFAKRACFFAISGKENGRDELGHRAFLEYP
jgi:hypothetical protein